MKKLISILSLLLVFLIQFGSVGFTYYRNDCSTSKSSTFTYRNEGCTCKKEISPSDNAKGCCQKVKSEKSCCQSKLTSCCTTNESKRELKLSRKCCNSTQLFFKVLSDPFNTYDSNLELSNDVLLTSSVYKVNSNKVIFSNSTSLQSNFNCNSPPFRNYETLVFIQSFLI